MAAYVKKLRLCEGGLPVIFTQSQKTLKRCCLSLFSADDIENVARTDAAAFEHFAKHALAGHDAISHLVVDRTMLVTLLADLRELQHRIAHDKARTNGKRLEVETLDDDVLAKRAVLHIGAEPLESFDTLVAEKAHLTVPWTGMGVIFDTPIGNKVDMLLLGFLNALDGAGADGFDGAHVARSFARGDASCATSMHPVQPMGVPWAAARRPSGRSWREPSIALYSRKGIDNVLQNSKAVRVVIRFHPDETPRFNHTHSVKLLGRATTICR